jgi:hypothetical protein
MMVKSGLGRLAWPLLVVIVNVVEYFTKISLNICDFSFLGVYLSYKFIEEMKILILHVSEVKMRLKRKVKLLWCEVSLYTQFVLAQLEFVITKI